MFDKKKFMQAKFEPRTEDVPVPDLAEFFPDLKDGEIPVWKVRGLSGVELGHCSEEADRNKNISAIVDGMASSIPKEKTKAVKELLGVGGKVPQDIAKRIAHFEAGSVEPKVDKEFAVRFCKVYPVEFYQCTNTIMKLTGQGHVPGKPKGSGKVKK